MYFGRLPAHQAINSSGRLLSRSFRAASFAVKQAEQRLDLRNKAVLTENALQVSAQGIEREFDRVCELIERDLGQFPNHYRQLKSSIEQVEKSYQASVEEVPSAPAWDQVLLALSKLSQNADPALLKVLNSLKSAVESSQTRTEKLLRQHSDDQHKLLARMQPEWRKLESKVDTMQRSMDDLGEREKSIAEQMKQYRSIQAGEDKSLHSLSASSYTQFLISGLVLMIAIMGGLINFQLIALPMSEMVGGASYIGNLKTSDIAALVVILIEIAMGLFLMESLRITRLFPLISNMDDSMRRKMMWISLVILCTLASIEASLAYMRDLLALDKAALQQSLAGTTTAEAHFRWIPSMGQMIMGFVLPFALAFIAIPLESFVHALRTVLGKLAQVALLCISTVFRLMSLLCRQLSKVLVALYDFPIMMPIAIEKFVADRLSQSKNTPAVTKESLR
jgi:prefoldin subunit 5